MSVVQEFYDREIARLEHSGWAINAALRQRLEAVGLWPPAGIVAECLDEGAEDGGGAGVRWAWAEHAVTRLRGHFAPLHFSNDAGYGLLMIPASNRLDTRGTMDLNTRRGQQPDLAEGFVDPALGEGINLTGSAGVGGITSAKDGWMAVVGVVGQYGTSAGSHEDAIAAVGLFKVDGVDTRTLMTRQIWGTRFLQCPPGLALDSDYAE